ncbi:unnamed protein product [Pleuronectes platessa]|uniref:Uncharacterized protein n=1 Tax=Pleuronectes platessa TaxID=8262 RepID=A0A9N7TRW2_PLEPL|nr:unnamed protein product [Pleuronectes platessa]
MAHTSRDLTDKDLVEEHEASAPVRPSTTPSLSIDPATSASRPWKYHPLPEFAQHPRRKTRELERRMISCGAVVGIVKKKVCDLGRRVDFLWRSLSMSGGQSLGSGPTCVSLPMAALLIPFEYEE